MLFEPLQAGHIRLANRIVMAPMTRSRADDQGVPGELMSTYYAQRASAGLIITEGAFPSPMGKGYVRTPGLHTDEQVAAWRQVTDAVHVAGGRIVVQLMHVGRISLPEFLPGGATPVAPSAIAPQGSAYTDAGMKPWGVPRALTGSEIRAVVEEYRAATQRAVLAGFDGVELHAASGYLPEQFLSSGANVRTDRYGGSIANRARFILELLEAMTSVRGGGYVGMKIAPEMGFNDIEDATPVETYTHLVRETAAFHLAYLHVAQTRPGTNYHALLPPLFGGAYFAGAGMTPPRAQSLLKAGEADGVVFGELFIANPDLPARIAAGVSLATADRSTFYSGGPRGYIDYPALTAQSLPAGNIAA